MGKFIAATSTDGYWDGETQITDVIIIDAASSSAAGALIKTSNLLKKSNWKTVGQNSDWIQMESDKWPGVEVTLESFASYGADTLMEDSRVAKAIRETLAHAKPESLIVADIGPAE
ncbi:hypothetical protein SAMN05421869_1239 [Nonomuraea jiangxiensis]|uniref:Uncharacterized protein n=1 Tax=Nonomuraea jiangxiensis TaxID=633440 RepID=A0A1G9HWT0_9ACTN|nr:hypothetical protein SAMN05421869_1239 [Nonomuraea jiangxiensis]